MKRPLDPVVTLSVVILAQARIQYPRYLPSAQPGLLVPGLAAARQTGMTVWWDLARTKKRAARHVFNGYFFVFRVSGNIYRSPSCSINDN